MQQGGGREHEGEHGGHYAGGHCCHRRRPGRSVPRWVQRTRILWHRRQMHVPFRLRRRGMPPGRRHHLPCRVLRPRHLPRAQPHLCMSHRLRGGGLLDAVGKGELVPLSWRDCGSGGRRHSRHGRHGRQKDVRRWMLWSRAVRPRWRMYVPRYAASPKSPLHMSAAQPRSPSRSYPCMQSHPCSSRGDATRAMLCHLLALTICEPSPCPSRPKPHLPTPYSHGSHASPCLDPRPLPIRWFRRTRLRHALV